MIMKTNFKQLLRQDVEAHNEKRFDEAERLYKEILTIQPEQPDSNHNLGVLKSSQNKQTEAILLFKKATEANIV